ncbi:MAG: bifunctional phosphoglucose/phosphomannose isomerase [Parcubacteria group bacterium]|nr:bifunctional phosphoglucose/phosphomannose isomerase [Parcubacteria group bacterium]
MREVILSFPKQFEKGIEIAKDIKIDAPSGGFENIIICGLGGSALPSNILTAYIPDLKIPVYSHRNYGLPSQANGKSLIVCISYSGNTEETISAYEDAIKKGFKVVAIATGGKLQEIAKDNNTPIAIIPQDALQPRFALGYQSSALITILSNVGIIKNKAEQMREVAQVIDPLQLEDQAKKIAKKLVDKIPVVYTTDNFKAIARIWKIKFNENSKIMAFFNYFPELNHNEMVGLTNLKGNFHFIILRDNEAHERNLKRLELFADLAKEKGASVDFIEMTGNNTLEKMVHTLVLGEWVTYFLALEYGQDPVPVKIVEEFKKRLKE